MPETVEAPPEPVRPLHKDPEQIGQYRILGKIGEGGMGVVYRAEQREPIRRVVALKVIKLGMDTREVVARFEAERQALALMNHPNVAKVLEAGITETGRPYFAMELVPGIDFTRYCEDEKLSVRQRLELFIPVCQAVQHAHQKGIIHRDLKPSNVLVQLVDGKPVPKVIDFGIAKAINQAFTQHTLFTKTGSMIGTPEYMSPEQAMTSGLDVDTRTDIYSLGVILYQVLTGTLPLDPKALRAAGMEGMARLIKNSEPQKPSTRTDHRGHGGNRADLRPDPQHAAASEGTSGRSGLDCAQGNGEGAKPALRDGQRAGDRPPAASGQQASAGPAAPRQLPRAGIRRSAPGRRAGGHRNARGAFGGTCSGRGWVRPCQVGTRCPTERTAGGSDAATHSRQR